MKMRAFLLVLSFISALILVNTASAGINITDAEAIYEANLSSVNVPTEPIPVKTIFTCNEEALMKQDLSDISIPTQPLPIEEIFSHLEEARFDKNLYTVRIPTEPSPIKELFIHLKEAKTSKELLYPIELFDDTTPPIITNVTATNITNNSAAITWNTDEVADSLVNYGKASGSYTESEERPLFVVNHTIELTGLSSGTTYYYVVTSTDRSGNRNESSEYYFTTPGKICGDVNCNKVVDRSDARDLLYYVGYPGQYTICSEWAADVNCDKSIDMSDVIDLLYYVGYPGEYELSCCAEISGGMPLFSLL